MLNFESFFFVFSLFSSHDLIIVTRNNVEFPIKINLCNCKIKSIKDAGLSTIPSMIFNFDADENNDVNFECYQNPELYADAEKFSKCYSYCFVVISAGSFFVWTNAIQSKRYTIECIIKMKVRSAKQCVFIQYSVT